MKAESVAFDELEVRRERNELPPVLQHEAIGERSQDSVGRDQAVRVVPMGLADVEHGVPAGPEDSTDLLEKFRFAPDESDRHRGVDEVERLVAEMQCRRVIKVDVRKLERGEVGLRDDAESCGHGTQAFAVGYEASQVDAVEDD